MANFSQKASSSGVFQFLLQRLSAVVILLYTLFLSGFIIYNPDLSYTQWVTFFQNIWVKVFSTLTLWSIVAHTWIGLWGVLTDYLTERLMGTKGTYLRLILLLLIALVSVVMFLFGTLVFWNI